MSVEYVEEVAHFGPDDRLSGITTRPYGDRREAGGIWCILPNSGVVPRSGAARLHVRLARALAEIGVSTLRLDLSGLGDSERSPDGSDPRHQPQADLEAARSFLRHTMKSRGEVFAGLCSAAYDAVVFMGASSGVRGVVAIDLISEYNNRRQVLAHYRTRLMRPKSWARALASPGWALSNLAKRVRGERTDEDDPDPSDGIGARPVMPQAELRAGLRDASERGVDLLFLFSGGLEDNYNYAEQFSDVFPEESRSGRVEHRFFPEARHIFDDLEQQAALIDAVRSWMEARLPGWQA